MSLEENKAIVRRYIEEVLNGGHLEVIEELFTPDMHEQVKSIATIFRTGFPDMHETIDDLIAEADIVAARWTFQGTHQGEFDDLPATGKPITMTGMSFYHLSGGKILDDWAEWDELGLLEQLGVRPQPE